MRLLSSIDWTLFFERVSVVERVLRGDPAGAYAQMDFPTRDRYRHSVEAAGETGASGGNRRRAQAVEIAPPRAAARTQRTTGGTMSATT